MRYKQGSSFLASTEGMALEFMLREGKKEDTAEQLCGKLVNRFVIGDWKQTKRAELSGLHQTGTFAEYEDAVYRLCHAINPDMKKEDHFTEILKGLKPHLRCEVDKLGAKTVEEIRRIARALEMHDQCTTTTTAAVQSMKSGLSRRCSNCGQRGHFARECRKKTCFRCGGRGHMQFQCNKRVPSHRMATVIGNETQMKSEGKQIAESGDLEYGMHGKSNEERANGQNRVGVVQEEMETEKLQITKMEVEINGRKALVPIDSDSVCTIFTVKAWKEFGGRVWTPCQCNQVAAEGSAVHVIGRGYVNVKVGKCEQRVLVLISYNVALPVILGVNVLHQLKLVLDYRHERVGDLGKRKR